MINQIHNQILVVTDDQQINPFCEKTLASAGYKVILHTDFSNAKIDLDLVVPELLILDEKSRDGEGLDFAAAVRRRFPFLPILLLIQQETLEVVGKALRTGINDYLCTPFQAEELLIAVQHCLQQSQQRREWMLLEAQQQTTHLSHQVAELETLARLGRSVTSSLDLDSVLTAVVDAAVQLSGAEEGNLLLLDESTGELYVRAARNFNEEFVRSFRLPVQDTLAGSVLRSGQPVLIDENTPQKIKTSYLVHSLLYVPLQINGRVIGVLGVDNRSKRVPFKEHDIHLLSTMADYAVIAIENARLFASVSAESLKLETILTRIQDGVIVSDSDQRLMMVNAAARFAFSLDSMPLEGKNFQDVFHQPELVGLMDTSGKSLFNRAEVNLPYERTLMALLTPIPDVGSAITLHDITYLKKLDRIKSDFVSTVSHDLRSPLTAVLGYIELIERAGPVNDMQREFIRRVQGSVHNITNLIDDLLNLGRVEAGLDTRAENLLLDQIIRYSAEGFKKQLAEKGHFLALELPENMPSILGNPVQIRQVVDHLLDNAIRYTQPGGSITIAAKVEEKQLIVQFRDTGIGIPSQDLPYIFDRFYRSNNACSLVSGTGLGLAIVKSVIDHHQGRIWVDSALHQGSTFTILLPLVEPVQL